MNNPGVRYAVVLYRDFYLKKYLDNYILDIEKKLALHTEVCYSDSILVIHSFSFMESLTYLADRRKISRL